MQEDVPNLTHPLFLSFYAVSFNYKFAETNIKLWIKKHY